MSRELNDLLAVVGESVECIQADPDMAFRRATLRKFPDYDELCKLPIEEAEGLMGVGYESRYIPVA